MSTEIKIPQLGMSMTEGALVEWLVSDGTEVKEGDLIYTLESDKTNQDIEAPASGKLKIIGQSGEDYEVGQVVGEII